MKIKFSQRLSEIDTRKPIVIGGFGINTFKEDFQEIEFKVFEYVGVNQINEESWDWTDIVDTHKIYSLKCNKKGILIDEDELWKKMREDKFLEDEEGIYDWQTTQYGYIEKYCIMDYEMKPLIRLERI